MNRKEEQFADPVLVWVPNALGSVTSSDIKPAVPTAGFLQLALFGEEACHWPAGPPRSFYSRLLWKSSVLGSHSPSRAGPWPKGVFPFSSLPVPSSRHRLPQLLHSAPQGSDPHSDTDQLRD